MLSFQEINALGQILNTTWGGTSTSVSPTCSIKHTNIVMGINPRDQVREQERESVEMLKQFVKNLEKSFKESTGKSLKLKEIGSDDSVEMISMSPHNPKRTAYYRRKTSFRIGD